MYGREIVRVGRAADGNWWSSWPSRVAAEDFLVFDAFDDVGDGCDGEGVILTPQSLPTGAMGVGRMLRKFCVD